MLCPKCEQSDSKVVDKRNNKQQTVIRRRRECNICGYRYTTHEKLESGTFLVRKKSGRLEEFDREKLKNSVLKGLKKRHIPEDEIENFVDQVEMRLNETRKSVIDSVMIGKEILESLKNFDKVAYMLYATVYLDFDCLEDIENQLLQLKNSN